MKRIFSLALVLTLCLAAPMGLAADIHWHKQEGWSLDGADQPEDGDSFKVKPMKGRMKPFTLRLYGVDTPETSNRIPAMVEDQAKEFKVDPKVIPKMGKAAREFTGKFLKDGFTIEACGEKATNGRRYGIVRNLKDERLDEALLKAGLARMDRNQEKNMAPFLPGKEMVKRKDEDRARRDFANNLFPMESKAKREKNGFWDKNWEQKQDLLHRPGPEQKVK